MIRGWFGGGYCSITVINRGGTWLIRFVSKNYTHSWKNFANKFRLVLHACICLFYKVLPNTFYIPVSGGIWSYGWPTGCSRRSNPRRPQRSRIGFRKRDRRWNVLLPIFCIHSRHWLAVYVFSSVSITRCEKIKRKKVMEKKLVGVCLVGEKNWVLIL